MQRARAGARLTTAGRVRRGSTLAPGRGGLVSRAPSGTLPTDTLQDTKRSTEGGLVVAAVCVDPFASSDGGSPLGSRRAASGSTVLTGGVGVDDGSEDEVVPPERAHAAAQDSVHTKPVSRAVACRSLACGCRTTRSVWLTSVDHVHRREDSGAAALDERLRRIVEEAVHELRALGGEAQGLEYADGPVCDPTTEA